MAEERTSARRRSCAGIILFALIVGFWIGAAFDAQFHPNSIRMKVEPLSSRVSLAPQPNDSIDWVDPGGNKQTVSFEGDNPCSLSGASSTCDVNATKGIFEYTCVPSASSPGCTDPALDVGSTGSRDQFSLGSKDLLRDLKAPAVDIEMALRDLRRTASKSSPNSSNAATTVPPPPPTQYPALSCSSGTLSVQDPYPVSSGTNSLIWTSGSVDSFSVASTACSSTQSASYSAACTLIKQQPGTKVPYTVNVTSGCSQTTQTFNLQF